MRLAAQMALNLAVNAVGSFAIAALVVLAVGRLFRVPDGRAKLALLALPFVKVVWDAAHGLPSDSFLLARAAGVARELGSFVVGLGFSAPGAVNIQVLLRAVAGERRYVLSAGDIVVELCDRAGAPVAPLVVGVLAAVALFLVARRAAAAIAFERARRVARAHAISSSQQRIGRRVADVFVTPLAACPAPHAGGIVRPYVCLPEAAFAALSPEEREAVIQHELAHIANHHLALLSVIGVLADVLWFVPGARPLARRIALGCELHADDAAIAGGAPATALASAMVRVAEVVSAEPARGAAVPALGFGGSALALRVRRLLDPAAAPPAPRLGFRFLLVRLAVIACTAHTVLIAVFAGNR